MSGILFLLSGLPSESYLVLKNNPLYIFLPFFGGCNKMKPVHLTMNPSSVSPNCDEATLIGNRTSAMSTTSWWLHNYSTCSKLNMIDCCMLVVIIGQEVQSFAVLNHHYHTLNNFEGVSIIALFLPTDKYEQTIVQDNC